jgi:hypothetical protein
MMKIRILEDTHKEIRGDLSRPHAHAKERVGFAFVRPSGDSALVITGYQAVPDEYYLVDETVGARISHKAIAEAMKRADHHNEGILHVHCHGGRGIPRFSRTDLQSHNDFLRSFQNANPQGIHGFLLLNQDNMLIRVWTPEQSNYHDICQYAIVGIPATHHWSEV